MHQSSMEQYLGPIYSSLKIWFCLAKERVPIHQKTSDYVTKSHQIFTDGLLALGQILCGTL